MQPNVSKLFVLVLFALGACASEPSAVRPGAGSNTGSNAGSNNGSDAGSGSDVSMGSGGSAQPPPPPGTLYGSVIDERGDHIDFSTGEPVHTHTGVAIDLASTGCPAVYKYAYLEDQTDPTFGRQTAINPLEWHVMSQVGSLDDSATAYRVRLDDGTVVLDWTLASPPDDTGLYTVRMYRNLASAVGDHTGKMWVDVRFEDTAGNETVDSACWENHPMAAPLEVVAATQGDLFGWTLPAHSPISTAINTASLDGTAEEQLGATVFTRNIVQHAAEPVTMHLDHSVISGNASMTEVSQWVGVSVTTVDIDCSSSTSNVACRELPPSQTPTSAASSGVLAATWNAHVVDTATGAVICHNPDGASPASAIDGCVLPARKANEAPHVYQLAIAMSGSSSIDPDSTLTQANAEQSVTSTAGAVTTFTGAIASGRTTCITNPTNKICSRETTWQQFDALDLAHIDFSPVQLSMQTAPDSTASLEVVGSYASPSLSIAAQSWDAGDAGLAP